MARPRHPLIDRTDAVRSALEIVDRDGLAKLSLRNLGTALGVNGMSLYHYFAHKEELLQEVAALVLSDIRVPPPPDGDDIATWSLRTAQLYRQALLAHPNAIPLFVERHPTRGRSLMYLQDFRVFARVGIRREHWLVILECMESFIVGSALYLRPDVDRTARLQLDSEPDQEVRGVIDASSADYEHAFDTAYLGLLRSLLAAYGGTSAPRPG